MYIKLNPQRRDAELTVSKQGDTLTVNGEAFDFSVIPDGATLPASAITSEWFAGPVERIGGELHVTLLLPHGANAPHETLFPAPITMPDDGPVELPMHSTPEPAPEPEPMPAGEDE